MWAMALAALFAAAWFAFQAFRVDNPNRPDGIFRTLPLAGTFVLMALVANAAYAGLQMAIVHYRTHILSRVWASLAVAVLSGWPMLRWPRFRVIFLLVPAVFVG